MPPIVQKFLSKTDVRGSAPPKSCMRVAEPVISLLLLIVQSFRKCRGIG
jgi:hypothetical protein